MSTPQDSQIPELLGFDPCELCGHEHPIERTVSVGSSPRRTIVCRLCFWFALPSTRGYLLDCTPEEQQELPT